MSTLVIGLGNPLGQRRQRRPARGHGPSLRLTGRADIDVTEDYWGGLWVIERLVGYDRAIVIDAIRSGAQAGDDPLSGPRRRTYAAPRLVPRHEPADGGGSGPPGRASFAGRRGIVLVGIEEEDILNFGETCTPAVAAAVPRAVADVLAILGTRPQVKAGLRVG